MSAKTLTGALRAHVKVLRTTKDGKQMLEPSGGFGPDGKPILQQSTRLVTVRRGEKLPDNLAKGELERLKQLGVLGDGKPKPETADETTAKTETETVSVNLDDLAGVDVETLAAWIGADNPDPSPTVETIVKAVGDSPELAGKLLEAEKLATKGDPRSTLAAQLEKVVAAGQGKS